MTFVADRIQEILEATQIDQWKHVRSEDNPANFTSRGLTVYNDKIRMWIEGPPFLREADNKCPDTIPNSVNNELLETRKMILHMEMQ